MDIFVKCLSFALTSLFLGWLSAYVQKQGKAAENTVSLHKTVRVIGVVCVVFFMLLTVVMMLTADSIWALFIFLFFVLLGAILILAGVNWRVTYDEEGFTFRNAIGRQRRYSYRDVTGICGTNQNITLYMDSRKINFDEMAVGKYEFLNRVALEYQKIHHGQDLPRAKKDIFRGNVPNPGVYVFLYGLFFVMLLCFTVAIAIEANQKPTMETAVVSFSSVDEIERDMRLYKDGDSRYYKIPEYESVLQDPDSFISACKSGERFTVSYESCKNYCFLHAITGEDGTVYLTEADIQAYHKAGRILSCSSLAVGYIICIFFAAGTFCVGRHPEKFSKKVVHLFFKEGYIHIEKPEKIQNKEGNKKAGRE